jgi:hypothetical protein
VKIPRDVHGDDFVKASRVLGCQFDRQDGSHMRLSTQLNGGHHITIPKNKPLETGTPVKGVLKPVAAHHHLTVEELLQKLRL